MMAVNKVQTSHLRVTKRTIEFSSNGEILRFQTQTLPDGFMDWQLQSRKRLFELLERGEHPLTFGAHLPIVATRSDKDPFAIHTSNKGAGLVPRPSVLLQVVEQYENCLRRSKNIPLQEGRRARVEVVRNFYGNAGQIDRRCLSLLEIFTGKTFDNIRKNPFVTLHFTGEGPDYRSYQINCIAQIISPDSLYYRFIYASRQLFEQERFHIQQPRYPFGYLFWVQQVYEKTPRQKVAGRLLVDSPIEKNAARHGEQAATLTEGAIRLESTFKKILVPVDNSTPSNLAVEAAVFLANKFDADIEAIHVYAARLHDWRFIEMEPDLPEQYRKPDKLKKQRDIHGSLITKGLDIISGSYMDVVSKKCAEHGIQFSATKAEGKNYSELVRVIHQGHYDLVVLGMSGLGDTDNGVLGSVCLRVTRRVKTDCFVVKNGSEIGQRIVVALDGSPSSFAGLKTALTLGRKLGAAIKAVAAYDPDFHTTAFDSLKGVLSKDAGNVFRLEEQERLHEEIINKGIARIYQGHLDTAKAIATEQGMTIETRLLKGKPYCAILDDLHEYPATLLVVGRVGIHADEQLDIGSNTENLLRLAPCNVLISSGVYKPNKRKR